MSLSENEKKLRSWFRRHGWSTGNTPTGTGFYMESPVQNSLGVLYQEVNPKTGKNQTCVKERYAGIELDRFGCKSVDIQIYGRNQWEVRDVSVPDNSFWYTTVPTDEFSEWESLGRVSIPAEDILKMAELIIESQKTACRIRKKKYSPRLFVVNENTSPRWIGRNTSYEKIKETYSNDRLRKERNCKDSYGWRP